ncbi:MAG: hypothetical protein ABII25_04015 [bacterium]
MNEEKGKKNKRGRFYLFLESYWLDMIDLTNNAKDSKSSAKKMTKEYDVEAIIRLKGRPKK